MILEKTRALLRKDRAAAQFLSCIKKIQRIDEKMKTAHGEKLQALADEMEALEIERDAIIERLIKCGADPGIETRG